MYEFAECYEFAEGEKTEIKIPPVEIAKGIVGKIVGKKAKTKARRAKKRATRVAGREAGDIDCVTGQYQAGGERGWPTKPHKEYLAAYKLAYDRCVAAVADCRTGQRGQSIPAKFPSQAYKEKFLQGYEEWYNKCPAGGLLVGGDRTKLLLLLAAGAAAILMVRRK